MRSAQRFESARRSSSSALHRTAKSRSVPFCVCLCVCVCVLECVCVCVCISPLSLGTHMSSRPFVWFACGRRSAMCAARGARAGGARWWGVAGCGRIGVTSATNTKRSTSHPHMHTPSLLHPFTPLLLYSSTPVLLYSCAPLLCHSLTLCAVQAWPPSFWPGP